MKVINYIYNSFGERGVKTFEKKVTALLKNNGFEGDVICHNAYMEKGDSRGSYYKCAEIELNKEIHVIREHITDSIFWDNWENPTTKDKRDLFLAVLANTDLKEQIV